ncbi:unnamed protein product [Closterium sp. Naga37s-1]|nr:unnamed protein product [Closterium sp. Naga37s-1]
MAQTLNDRLKGSTATSDGRVILHVDLDCFYAAVEAVRLGIPRDTPLAVQQWEGLIAVNYAARARGVQRHDRVFQAKQKCPELQLIHVETVGGAPGAGRNAGKVSLERYRAASQHVFAAFRRVCPTVERASIDEAYMDVSTKVDAMLSRPPPAVPPAPDEASVGTGGTAEVPAAAWEEQWRELLGSVTEVTAGSAIEVKAGSVTEVKGDATEEGGDCGDGSDGVGTDREGSGEEGERKAGVQQPQLEQQQQRVGETKREHGGAEEGGGGSAVALAVPKARLVVREGPLDARDDVERRLQAGVVIAHRLQQEVLSSLGYTVSVGVARCKLLAKMASAMTKPFGITVVPPRAVPALMEDVPLKKIRNLGGKLGQELQAMGCATAGQAHALELPDLIARFGERLGNYVWRAVRGLDETPVEEKGVPKSMLAAKSFNATSSWDDIWSSPSYDLPHPLHLPRLRSGSSPFSSTAFGPCDSRWMTILAQELSLRMLKDAKDNKRRPRSLHLHYRGGSDGGGGSGGWGGGGGGEKSRSCGMPRDIERVIEGFVDRWCREGGKEQAEERQDVVREEGRVEGRMAGREEELEQGREDGREEGKEESREEVEEKIGELGEEVRHEKEAEDGDAPSENAGVDEGAGQEVPPHAGVEGGSKDVGVGVGIGEGGCEGEEGWMEEERQKLQALLCAAGLTLLAGGSSQPSQPSQQGQQQGQHLHAQPSEQQQGTEAISPSTNPSTRQPSSQPLACHPPRPLSWAWAPCSRVALHATVPCNTSRTTHASTATTAITASDASGQEVPIPRESAHGTHLTAAARHESSSPLLRAFSRGSGLRREAQGKEEGVRDREGEEGRQGDAERQGEEDRQREVERHDLSSPLLRAFSRGSGLRREAQEKEEDVRDREGGAERDLVEGGACEGGALGDGGEGGVTNRGGDEGEGNEGEEGCEGVGRHESRSLRKGELSEVGTGEEERGTEEGGTREQRDLGRRRLVGRGGRGGRRERGGKGRLGSRSMKVAVEGALVRMLGQRRVRNEHTRVEDADLGENQMQKTKRSEVRSGTEEAEEGAEVGSESVERGDASERKRRKVGVSGGQESESFSTWRVTGGGGTTGEGGGVSLKRKHVAGERDGSGAREDDLEAERFGRNGAVQVDVDAMREGEVGEERDTGRGDGNGAREGKGGTEEREGGEGTVEWHDSAVGEGAVRHCGRDDRRRDDGAVGVGELDEWDGGLKHDAVVQVQGVSRGGDDGNNGDGADERQREDSRRGDAQQHTDEAKASALRAIKRGRDASLALLRQEFRMPLTGEPGSVQAQEDWGQRLDQALSLLAVLNRRLAVLQTHSATDHSDNLSHGVRVEVQSKFQVMDQIHFGALYHYRVNFPFPSPAPLPSSHVSQFTFTHP